MKKEITIGTEFEIPENFKEIIKEYSDQQNANMVTIGMLSETMMKRKEKMWGLIKQIIPETIGHNCIYNSETNKVKIINKSD